jgi:hypothetical protein
MHLNHVAKNVWRVVAVRQRAKLLAVGSVDRVVGIHPEQPLALGVLERLIAGRRKVVDPGILDEAV